MASDIASRTGPCSRGARYREPGPVVEGLARNRQTDGETEAEVLGGLKKAFGDYEKKNEPAWK